MPIDYATTNPLPAFNANFMLGPENMGIDRHFWDNYLKDYAQTQAYGVTKQFLITILLHNYKKIPMTTAYSDIGITFRNFRRSDTADTVVNYIKRCNLNTYIHFISKTSLSGRQIGLYIAALNEDENITITEDTATSLYLQPDNAHPVRVLKLTTTEPEATTYFVIGTNHMYQNVFYTCLALAPKWFPHILDGIEPIRKEALLKVFSAIGNMDKEKYHTAIMNCIALCYEPEAQPIDFTPITNLLQADLDTKIGTRQTNIREAQRCIDNALAEYTRYTQELQKEQNELTRLLAEPKQDNELAINDAKNCKSIIDYNIVEGKHVLTIKSKLMLDSTSIVKKILHPDNTQALAHYNIPGEKARRLLEDLWLKNTLQMFFCTAFAKSPTVSVPSRCLKPTRTKETKHTMPNPHLVHYTCFGNNKKQLIDAATSNNLQYYLGTLTACNSNLNTGDATVLRRFCSDLFDVYFDKPILYDVENKTYVTPRRRMEQYETV